MKTFEDLEFKKHPNSNDWTKATMEFPDGSSISLITGGGSYSGTRTYEMMSNRTNRQGGIRGWVTPEQITSHMKYIQKNPMK